MPASAIHPPNPVVISALLPHAPVLVPTVGGHRCREVAATIAAMREISRTVVARQADAMVLISPHAPRHRSAFGLWGGRRLRGSLARFGAPHADVELPNDELLEDSLAGAATAAGLSTWDIRESSLDHGSVVPLWFLAEAGWQGPTVIVSLNYPGSGLEAKFGEAIVRAAERCGRRLAVIASGDMSHRLTTDAPCGFHPRAAAADRAVIDRLRAGDFRSLPRLDPELLECAAEDAVDSTTIAAAAGGWSSAGHHVLSYEGPFGVGYGVAILHDATEDLSAKNQAEPDCAGEARCRVGGSAQHPAGHSPDYSSSNEVSNIQASQSSNDTPCPTLVEIARESVAAALGKSSAVMPCAAADAPATYSGVFVTLHDHNGQLRGCIGSIDSGDEDLIGQTWRLARAAAFRDSRFPPVTAEEFDSLRFEVSSLLEPEPIVALADLDPAIYGVIVIGQGGRRGVLLPGIPTVATPQQQVAIAKRKAGLAEHESCTLERFRVVRSCEAENP